MRKKADLPTKICATCGRPFAWRKKWARDWEAVRYCSDRCRAARPKEAPSSGTDLEKSEGPSSGRAAVRTPR